MWRSVSITYGWHHSLSGPRDWLVGCLDGQFVGFFFFFAAARNTQHVGTRRAGGGSEHLSGFA